MIQKYQNRTAYDAAGLPISESRVATIDSENIAVMDGVNVVTSEPKAWDILYVNPEGKGVIIKRDTWRPDQLPSTWKYVGPVLERADRNHVRAIWGNNFNNSLKYCDVVQFKVTIPEESGTITMGARFVNVNSDTIISVAYEAGMSLTTLCGRINEALDEVEGITGDWWAYVNNDNEVILQRDVLSDTKQFNCSGALTFVTWRDMPATSASYLKADGQSTLTRGLLNESGAITYWSTSGRTPTSQVPAHISGSDNPVKRDCFEDSTNAAYAYCDLLRAEYGTYENYIIKCFAIDKNQKLSVFSDEFDAEKLTKKYGVIKAPTKAGGTKSVFPALAYPLTIGYDGIEGLDKGDLYLWGAHEGLLLMPDAPLALFNETQRKVNKATIGAGTSCWYAQRYGAANAWFFHKTTRMLVNYYVNFALLCASVVLYRFKD